MAEKEPAKLVVTFKSKSMMKRLEKEADRLGLPKSSLVVLALDRYLPEMPPTRAKRAYKRPEWAPTVEVVKEHFDGHNLLEAEKEAQRFVEYYDDRQWRSGKANRKLTGWHGVAGNWGKSKEKIPNAAPVAADFGNMFLSDSE